jgi:hypothetical protein
MRGCCIRAKRARVCTKGAIARSSLRDPAAARRRRVVSASLTTPRPAMTAAERKADRKANPPLAMITLTVMLGLIMAIIDTSIVNVR